MELLSIRATVCTGSVWLGWHCDWLRLVRAHVEVAGTSVLYATLEEGLFLSVVSVRRLLSYRTDTAFFVVGVNLPINVAFCERKVWLFHIFNKNFRSYRVSGGNSMACEGGFRFRNLGFIIRSH